jgi:uncharacterized protein (DUF58 family)
LTAKHLAAGLYVGQHASSRRGAGVEFGGHRNYLPGDDLRRLDYRAFARHGKLLVREFETETERKLCLLMDATASMGYSSTTKLPPKFVYCALLAAALGRLVISGGDPVGLDWLGGRELHALPSSGGTEAFHRLIAGLETAQLGGDETLSPEELERSLVPVNRRATAGSIVLFFSDLVDLPLEFSSAVAALSTRRRKVVVVQVLDPAEVHFPFDGPVRLHPSSGSQWIETDARAARDGYLEALSNLQQRWRATLLQHGSSLLTVNTEEEPTLVLRQILAAIRNPALADGLRKEPT